MFKTRSIFGTRTWTRFWNQNWNQIFWKYSFLGEKRLGPAINQCWAVLTVFWDPSGPVLWGRVLTTALVLFLKKVFPFWEPPQFSKLKKNSVRRFSESAVLTEFWTLDFQGRFSQVGSHKLWFFVIYNFFLQSAFFLCEKNFALLWNLKITCNKVKGFFFLIKKFSQKNREKKLFATFKLCASRDN